MFLSSHGRMVSWPCPLILCVFKLSVKPIRGSFQLKTLYMLAMKVVILASFYICISSICNNGKCGRSLGYNIPFRGIGMDWGVFYSQIDVSFPL